MKYRTTNRDVRNGYRAVLLIGYCDLQHLLTWQNPVAYTAGVYGWNADIYDVGNDVAICTGYRPVGKRVNFNTVREYDNRAKEILADRSIPDYGLRWETQRKKLNDLIQEFINTVLNENET